jgi:hypothetical protein
VKRLRMVVFGQAKIGKSRLAETCPGPRLILDAEGGTEYLKNPQTLWADVNQPPPSVKEDGSPIGPEDSVVLFVGDWRTFVSAHQWLRSGQHPFVSVVLDSLTELQKRCKDDIVAGGGMMDQRAWGKLLDQMELELRNFRDLTKKGANPLACVVITALVDERNGVLRSMVQGALAKSLGGMYDVIGYLRATEADEYGRVGRELCIGPNREFEAGDRTDLLTEHYGVVIRDPNVLSMMQVLNA